MPTAPTDAAVAATLFDLARAADGYRWALVGGQALRAHGVPHQSPGVAMLAEQSDVRAIVDRLCTGHSGWTCPGRDGRVAQLVSSTDVIVKVAAVGDEIERGAVAEAMLRPLLDLHLPVAPLGAVLLMKMRFGRMIDVAAIEQTAEHVGRAELDGELAWAERHDAAGAEQLRAIVAEVRRRRTPVGVRRVPREAPESGTLSDDRFQHAFANVLERYGEAFEDLAAYDRASDEEERAKVFAGVSSRRPRSSKPR